MRPSEIAKRVKKTNGKLGKVDSVRKTIRKFKRTKGKWDGERTPGSGPPGKLTEKGKAQIVKLVFAKRGKAVVRVGTLASNTPTNGAYNCHVNKNT